jgi:hypothetical protein
MVGGRPVWPDVWERDAASLETIASIPRITAAPAERIPGRATTQNLIDSNYEDVR